MVSGNSRSVCMVTNPKVLLKALLCTDFAWQYSISCVQKTSIFIKESLLKTQLLPMSLQTLTIWSQFKSSHTTLAKHILTNSCLEKTSTNLATILAHPSLENTSTTHPRRPPRSWLHRQAPPTMTTPHSPPRVDPALAVQTRHQPAAGKGTHCTCSSPSHARKAPLPCRKGRNNAAFCARRLASHYRGYMCLFSYYGDRRCARYRCDN